MNKKINIILVLLVLLVSISAVNAVDDNNETVVNEAIEDTLEEVSVSEELDDSSSEVLQMNGSDSQIAVSSYSVTVSNYNRSFYCNGN